MKKWRFNGPLLFKITRLVLVVTLLSVGVTTIFVARLAQRSLETRAREDMSADDQKLSLRLSASRAAKLSGTGDLQEQVEFLERLTRRTIRILDASGQLVAGSAPSGFGLKDYFAAYVNLEVGAVLQVCIS